MESFFITRYIDNTILLDSSVEEEAYVIPSLTFLHIGDRLNIGPSHLYPTGTSLSPINWCLDYEDSTKILNY